MPRDRWRGSEQLRLVQTVPRRSILKGSVKRARTGDGQTTLGSLSGTTGVKIRLNLYDPGRSTLRYGPADAPWPRAF